MDDFGQPMQDKVVLIVWCSVIVLAAVKYCYESRRADVPPLGRTPPEERKVADKEAQKELLDKLHESMIHYHTKPVPNEDDPIGDIEEGTSSSSEGEEMIIPRICSNACAICLEEFEEDETVVHSLGTNECPHIFHETCMKEVVAAAIRKDIHCIPCPCCRQPYVSTEIQARGHETQV